MNPHHAERLRQLGNSSHATADPGFLRGLTESDQDLAGSIAEETVANMTSGQQQPPSPATLEDLAELSIDAVDPTDIEAVEDAFENEDSERY